MKSLSVGHAPFTMKRPIDNCQTTDFTNASIRKRLNPRSMIWLLCMHYHFQPNISFLPFTTPRTSRFYVLPKIHKTNNTGRPIVSACSCPMENISAFLDEVMTPLVRGLPTYVIDTNHDFHIFDSLRFDTTDPGQRFLITMDVKSLYTVIPNDCGLQALTCSSKTHDVKVPSTSTLIRPAELVLKLMLTGAKWGLIMPAFSLGTLSTNSGNSTQAVFPNYTGGISTTLLEQLHAGERNWKPVSTLGINSTWPFKSLPLSLK